MMTSILLWSGLITMALANLGAMLPPWRSATLSPDSIQRRIYWVGNALAIGLLSATQIPEWRNLLFFVPAMTLWFAFVAFKWTNHIKINGRVYAMDASDRRPDRPPALAPDTDEP